MPPLASLWERLHLVTSEQWAKLSGSLSWVSFNFPSPFLLSSPSFHSSSPLPPISSCLLSPSGTNAPFPLLHVLLPYQKMLSGKDFLSIIYTLVWICQEVNFPPNVCIAKPSDYKITGSALLKNFFLSTRIILCVYMWYIKGRRVLYPRNHSADLTRLEWFQGGGTVERKEAGDWWNSPCDLTSNITCMILD